MKHNKWLFLCLTLGSIFVTALMCSIPIYADGILQRMLIKDLENYERTTGKFPGEWNLTWQLNYNIDGPNRLEKFETFEKEKIDRWKNEIELPILSEKLRVIAGNTSILAMNRLDKKGNPVKIQAELWGIQGIEDQIEITHGRMFKEEAEGEYLEVIVSKNALKKLDILLDETYIGYSLLDVKNREEALQTGQFYPLKIVGVYEQKDNQDGYWQIGKDYLDTAFLLPYNTLQEKVFRERPNWFKTAQWSIAYDYHAMNIDQVEQLESIWKSQEKVLKESNDSTKFSMNALKIIETYTTKRESLLLTMWILIIPVMIMLIFYIFMISQLIVLGDKNEITQLKSRGASKTQIFSVYLIESLVISLVALLIGPFLGLAICRVLGLANGFLEFVGRKALDVHLDGAIYGYALIAQVIFITSMLIPSMVYSRASIVEHKRKEGQKNKKPFWKKVYLDIIFLALSAYGIYQYMRQQKILQLTQLEGSTLGIDPIIFIVSTLFVIGAALGFLRIYPWIIKIIFQIGKKRWNPICYATFTNVGRIGGQEQFIMLFMMMAMAIGIMNANQARTLNQNLENKIRYLIGADVVVQPTWVDLNNPDNYSLDGYVQTQELSKKEPRYVEPPFYEYEQLEGVEKATKVIVDEKSSLKLYGERKRGNVTVMGIETYGFGQTAWFDHKLLPTHINNYLNLMASETTAVLVSSNLKEEWDVKVGDVINIALSNGAVIDGVIYQFIDYWPTFNPVGADQKNHTLVVTNYQYLTNKAGLMPYNIWLRKQPGITDRQLVDSMQQKKLKIDHIAFSDNETVESKNDPFNMGMNGILTLGFIVIMIITTIGFIIYWILSIRSRTLQFGVLRAMGLKQQEVFAMIGMEQILLSLVAILVGIIIGGIGSELFVPLVQLVSSAKEQVPPLIVTAQRSDYYKIYIIAGSMLILGTGIVIHIIKKLKISQALKLGED